MSRSYIHYRLSLREPVILSNGSQMGNILTTQDFIPGSTILGFCAGLYLRDDNGVTAEDAHKDGGFRALFLSDKTIFSPAYPVAEATEKTIPVPLSVLGCKYYGWKSPHPTGRPMHGIFDYLYKDIPDTCPQPSCKAPVEHKGGYAYLGSGGDLFSHEVCKRIISHNRVAESSSEKDLFSFEAISEGQEFYGEISFSDEKKRDDLFNILIKNPVGKLGKARRRGYGTVEFYRPVKKDTSFREELGNISMAANGTFSIYLHSDAIVLDKALNYCSRLDEESVASLLGIKPDQCEVFSGGPGQKYRSFWKNGIVMGFNEKRRMPLPMEQSIVRGSVFTVQYKGTDNISASMRALMENGVGVRRNEGFGQVIINLLNHP